MCVVTAAVVSLAGAAPAAASAGPHIPAVTAGILGSIFGSLGHAVLGAFSWTIGLASKFILTTIGALVRMLIPRSWANKGVAIMEWIVAVPNYAGTVTTPAGRTVYGFGGINALRDLFTWIGVGLLPLTLLYGTTRAMLGERGHVAVPVARVLGVAAVLVSYPYWWTRGGGDDRHAHAHDPDAAASRERPAPADALRRRRGRARRLAARRPGADGGGGDRAAVADLPQGRDHPARRSARTRRVR